MSGRFLLRVIFALVVIASLVGAGAVVYNAGVAQGMAAGADGGAAAPFYRPVFFPGFGLLFCLPLLLLFFLFPLFGGMRRWGWRKHRGDWGDKMPPRVEEWHRRMHEAESKPDQT